MFATSGTVATDETTVLGYGISHATSTDLVHWTMSAGNPVLGGGTLKGTPAVLDTNGTFELWFHDDSTADTNTVPSILFPTLGLVGAMGTMWTDQATIDCGSYARYLRRFEHARGKPTARSRASDRSRS